MEGILLPNKIEITEGERPNEHMLVMEPFFHGYGHTVGNALRRVLLSSLPGAAVTAVKIAGAQHEFMGIPNVKEDVLEIILNLKRLRLKVHSDEPVKLTLKAKGEKTVTAEDFDKNADVEIVNPEMEIATLTAKDAELEMEVTVSRGRGYVPTEDRGRERGELGVIHVDALFSPIRSVGYKVEDVRVGQITNYDRLTLAVETDGSISAEDAIRQSARILVDHFNLLADPEAAAAAMAAKTPAMVEDLPETAGAEEAVGTEETPEEEEKPKRKRASKK